MLEWTCSPSHGKAQKMCSSVILCKTNKLMAYLKSLVSPFLGSDLRVGDTTAQLGELTALDLIGAQRGTE